MSLLLCATLLSTACTGAGSKRHLAAILYPSAVFEMDNRSCTLALTIDDAPHPTTTQAIARMLARHDARATFFVIGSRVNDLTRPLLEQLLRDGHEVASHGWTEARAIFQPLAEFEREVARTHELLRELAVSTGTETSPWFRPGWALYNSAMLELVSGEPFHYRVALADVFPADTEH